jgi:predicted DNA-binding transcriptional regulator AlpA
VLRYENHRQFEIDFSGRSTNRCGVGCYDSLPFFNGAKQMRTEPKKMSRLINRTELLYRVGIGWATIDKRMALGTFPAGRRDGTKWLWLESEIEDYIAGTWRDKLEA